MKVLLLGATGNLGSRLLPALIAHNHDVVVYVRSSQKLKNLISPNLLAACTVVTGNATDSSAITDALIKHKRNAVVNSAGLAAIFPWQADRMQKIIDAVASAAVTASEQLGGPIRCWFLGGLSALDLPGSGGTALSSYLPVFTEHGRTYACLAAKPAEKLQWSMLCPSVMVPAEKSITLLEAPRGNRLSAAADVPPCWSDTYFRGVPGLGAAVSIVMNAGKYTTELEECADFIAEDLGKGGSSLFVGHRVGVFDKGKGKVE